MQLCAADTDRHSANFSSRDKDKSIAMGDNASAYVEALQRYDMSSRLHGLHKVMSCKLEQSLCTFG